MNVFDLQGKISLDNNSFLNGLTKSERGMKDFGDKMSAGFERIKKAASWLLTGVAIKTVISGIKDLATETANVGDKIDKQSQALGMSRKAYQQWDYILSQSGGSIDSLGMSMRTLNSAITSGSGETEEALKAIGLSANDLADLSQEDAFEQVIRAFQKLPAGAQKSALAVKLLGRSGMELLPLLNSDIYTLDILRAKAEDLGLVMSDDAVDASVAYTDALDTLQRTFNGLKYSIGSKVLPTLTRAFTNITEYASKIRKAYEKEGLSGVFKTLVQDIRNIKWPTWSDVSQAVTEGWNAIVSGVEGLARIVFGENVDGDIDWPTWDSIGDDLTNAWNFIVDQVANLAGLVFGKNEDGTVNWPKLSDLTEAAQELWRKLLDFVGNVFKLGGVLIFGKNEKGEVNWPKYSSLTEAAKDIWGKIVLFVADVANLGGKLIFGTTEDGEVNWPKYSSLTEAAKEIWGKIQAFVTDTVNLGGKLLFGTNEDGEVNWPKLSDLTQIAKDLWGKLLGFVGNVFRLGGVLLFGENEEGEVNWPKYSSLTEAAKDIWGKIKEFVASVVNLGGKLLFGTDEEGEVNWPDIKDLKDSAKGIWGELLAFVSNTVNLGGKLLFGTNENGEVNWPKLSDLTDFAKKLWRRLLDFVGNVFKLGGILIFGENEDGTVNWPTWATVKAKAIEIWDEIKREAANLKGLVFGDAADAASVFTSIKEAWVTLRSTIEEKAIEIGKYFFGEGEDGTTVASAIKMILDAVVAFGTGFVVYKAVTGISSIVSTLKSLFTLKFTGNSTALILGAIATAFTLIAENWDDIKSVLDNAVKWMDENVFQPISGFIQDYIIGPVQTIIDKVHEALVALGIIQEESHDLPSGISAEDEAAFDKFKEDLTQLQGERVWKAIMGNYPTAADAYKDKFGLDPNSPATNYVMSAYDRVNQATDIESYNEAMKEFYTILSEIPLETIYAKAKINELGEAVKAVPTDNTINFDVTTSGEDGLLGLGPSQRTTPQRPKKNVQEMTGSMDGSHASGLWDVPYNDYAALLHEGEMVLTRSQANDYRNGEGIGNSAAIVSAIQRLETTMANLQLVVGGREFGRATVRYGGYRMDDYIGGMDSKLAAGYGS